MAVLTIGVARCSCRASRNTPGRGWPRARRTGGDKHWGRRAPLDAGSGAAAPGTRAITGRGPGCSKGLGAVAMSHRVVLSASKESGSHAATCAVGAPPEKIVPAGRLSRVCLAPGRVRRPVFRVAGTGARWVGGRAATLLLLFSAPGGRGRGRVRRRSAPACQWCVFLGACLPQLGQPVTLPASAWCLRVELSTR